MATLAEQNDHSNITRKNNKRSTEEYILDKFRWVILTNYDDLEFRSKKYFYNELNERLKIEMIDKLIREYSQFNLDKFKDFSILLKKYKKYILNSFNTVTSYEINE